MANKLIDFAKMIRRNWKKSTFFVGIVAYGISYGAERYRTFQMMRAYCEEAKEFGEKIVPSTLKPKHVTVILNPEANDKKSVAQFEKFAAPLLHLAGFKVSIFQTEHEKQAQDLMEVMSNTDAVLIAGGDGTVHEAVTGLLRRPENEDESLPLGIIPLGKTNTVATNLFGAKSSSHAQLMAEAAMAVIREKTLSLDVMKIEHLDDKPIYAASSFEQGVFAETDLKVQKYWYLDGLKDKFTYFVNSFKSYDPVSYFKLEYVPPCGGCSRCYSVPKAKGSSNQEGRWWSVFVPKPAKTKVSENYQDFSKVVNEDCGKIYSLPTSYSNFSVFLSSAGTPDLQNKSGMLWIKSYPKDLSMKEFFTLGLSHRKSKLQSTSEVCHFINARKVKIDFENLVSSVDLNSNDSSVESSGSAKVDVNKNLEISAVETDFSDDATKEPNHSESSSSNQEEVPKEQELNPGKSEVYCYVDKEKYRMTSCEIALIPKQIVVFG